MSNIANPHVVTPMNTINEINESEVLLSHDNTLQCFQ